MRQAWIMALLWLAAPSWCLAQSSSLYGDPMARAPLTLAKDSWYFLPAEPVKTINQHDIITVVVRESSQVVSEGEVQRRTQSNLDVRLRNWVQLQHFSLVPLPSSVGEPRVRGSNDNQINSTAEISSQDLISFRIAARVVDVRPNGNLVIEAHRTIRNNDEVWEQSLTGIVRREDVSPQNTVDSEDVSELQIHKREAGHVRDASRRGWLIKTLDRFKPF